MNDDIRNLLDKLKIVSHEEYIRMLQEGGFLICVRVSAGGFQCFPDNQQGKCGACEAESYFRPYNAVAVNKLCIQCATILFRGDGGSA